MKKLTLALSAASLALVGAVGAVAQDRPDGGGMGMARGMDTDRTMNWAEFKAHADEGFARIDANHDGVIDKTDRAAMRDQMRNRLGSAADHRPDGPPPAPPGDMGPGGGHRVPGMAGGMPGGMGAMMMLRGADSDQDGKITRAEYDASIKLHFDAMDTNHDGQISKEERQAAHAKMRAEMQKRMRERGGEMGENMGGEKGHDMGGMHHGPDHGPADGSGGEDMPPPAQ